MGAETLTCCQAHPQQGNLFLSLEEDPQQAQLSLEQYHKLRQQLREVNLLSAIDYQIRQIQSSDQHLRDINTSFPLINKFIEVLELQSQQSILSIIHSKTYELSDLNNNKESLGSMEVCLLDSDALKQKHQSQISKINQQIFKILHLIQLQQPLHDHQPDVLFQTIVEELRSIPGSEDFLWEIQRNNSINSLVFHLRYNLPKYLPYLNKYLSLHDPTSYSHIKTFYHLVDQHFCQGPIYLTSQKYSCTLKTTLPQTWLFRKNMLLVSTNFLNFYPEKGARLNIDRSESNNEEYSEGSVIIYISPSSSSKQPKKFIHNHSLIYLPFTMFMIQKVIRSKNKVSVLIAEIQDQAISNQLKKTGFSEAKEKSNVLINQNNLVNELRSLRGSLYDKLDSKVTSDIKNSTVVQNERPQIDQLFTSYFQTYLTQVPAKLGTQHMGSNQADDREAEKGEAFQESEEEVHPMIEINEKQAIKMQARLDEYIEENKMQKLYDNLCSVDKFYQLKCLNISQIWLHKIQHMNCFPNLTHLFLYTNELTKIEGLESNKFLQVLSLSRNRLLKLQNMEHLNHLKELYLTKNMLDIDSSKYLITLPIKYLKKLSISFVEDQDVSFETLAHKAQFKIRNLVINQAYNLSSRTKNMLSKRLRKTNILYFDL